MRFWPLRTQAFMPRVEPAISGLMPEAERVGASFSEKPGVRSLDILHAAAALVTGGSGFWAFDARQGSPAKAAGLNVA